ncbi:MAG: GNAT family N-acetyltransferase, partial [Saprospiraceae bacterium]
LAVASWSGFKEVLTGENWNKLNGILNDPDIFIDLLNQSECILCTNIEGEIIGMAFLVPRGNPTHIYDADWSYIRFVSVHPDFGGKGIGKTLTEKCIKSAKENNEKIIALHTSEIMGKAISIYEKLGFRILRELEPSLGKKYWLYTLEL